MVRVSELPEHLPPPTAPAHSWGPIVRTNGATETIRYGIRRLSVSSQNWNTQKYRICVVSLS
ncbi:hypothetical protein PGT21_023847 [Puccinia graminis f. sp. tritici]|uniref:Uncharacterized protein n=1 Tax=Puccinia graminis f. sp. tritici TaxID=56615 RepID=A0A5B0M3E5_PUCGR|nr:hypothetical protein PGT21_023847 [Puccinia graminis f. sp. tritici]